MLISKLLFSISFFFLLTACLPLSQIKIDAAHTTASNVTIDKTPLDLSFRSCTDTFTAHDLDHITAVPGGETVRQFEANGGGVAINDLDNDGDLDIVLANHAEPNTLLWNNGDLMFNTERLPHGDSRAVNIIDVDGDGWHDIVFTQRIGAPRYWRNLGQEAEIATSERFEKRFQQTLLPGVSKPAYTMDWADLDGDGDLDFVTGSYDASLLIDLGSNFLLDGGGGVYYYENQQGRFVPTQLASKAQALTIVLLDLNADQSLDILVGNDFAVPDMAWMRDGDGWYETMPFGETTHSTMGFDYGDIDNDGHFELFATDMKPIDSSSETLAIWEPFMATMSQEAHRPSDPQIMENVLQKQTSDGVYHNHAPDWGIDATGWSWSGKFGDMDNDGQLDLYVVNGMIEQKMFGYLPNHELQEPNQAFRNNGDNEFIPMPDWGLSSLRSGRGMSMADLDNDGDLDIIVNNLRTPAQLFENQHCTGASLLVDLYWPNSANTQATGAVLTLYTSIGDLRRTVRSGSGYLSGDPSRIHFGFPDDSRLDRLKIEWPDGQITILDELSKNTLMRVERFF